MSSSIARGIYLAQTQCEGSCLSLGETEDERMSKGIYTAVSGAMAQTAKMDTIANNLANVNTPGFKKDTQIFKEYLSAYEKEPTAITVPRIPASIESFYD